MFSYVNTSLLSFVSSFFSVASYLSHTSSPHITASTNSNTQ